MRTLLGCEVGNFDTKFMTRDPKAVANLEERGYKRDPKESVVVLNITNVVSPAVMVRTLGNGMSSLENLLDVTIETKPISEKEASPASGRWFVGGMAIKEGKQHFKPTRETLKSSNPMALVMLLTTTAFGLYDPKEPVKTETIALGTLLPTEEYFEEPCGKMFLDKLSGEHIITFNHPSFKGAKITLNIMDEELLPEGTASLMATTYNWDGSLADPEVEKKTVMNIDFGSHDLSVSIMQNGEFLGKGFFGLKAGTTDVLRDIAKEIHSTKGILFDTHVIDYHLRNTNKPLLIPTSKEGPKPLQELIQIAKTHYFNKAWLIADQLTEELRDRDINKEHVHQINLWAVVQSGSSQASIQSLMQSRPRLKFQQMHVLRTWKAY